MTSPNTVTLRIDQQEVQALEGESILQVAQRYGKTIPHLCFKEGLRPDGNCRACVVEIDGERTLAPSCCRSVTAGMNVTADIRTDERRMIEYLLAPMLRYKQEALRER